MMGTNVQLEAGKAIAKVWGRTTPLVVTPVFELHFLQIKPLHRCSFHKHRHKHNVFFVLAGELFIDSDCNGDKETQRIGFHEWFSVAPSCKHQFRTGADYCTALEMYYPEPLSEDIVRYNVGAPITSDYGRQDIGCEDQKNGELQN